MATVAIPPRYADPVYQAAHDDAFSNPLVAEIEEVLPPGVSREDFDRALDELATALGKDFVFTGKKLKEYVDPYEIPEGAPDRKLPGGAVWYFAPFHLGILGAMSKMLTAW